MAAVQALLILFTVFYGSEAEMVPIKLDLSNLQVLIKANCCLVDREEPCKEQECPIMNLQPGKVADGNATTEWIVGFVSNISENGPRAEFSFNLQQVYTLHSITLLSTTEFLPRNWSLMLDSKQDLEFHNDGSYKERVLLVEEGGQELQTSRFQLLITLPSLASPNPVSIAEIIVTITGSDLGEEEGCGACTEQLTDTLNDLTVVISNSSSGLGGLVNTSQEEFVQREIMDTQISVRMYEDSLLVLAVVLGLHPPLLEGIQLSPGVVRYDLLLVPPIPTKLNQTEMLLDLAESYNLITSVENLISLLETIEPKLAALLSNSSDLMSRATDHRDDLVELIARLRSELNATTPVLMEISRIFTLVSSRNFNAEAEQFQRYNVQAIGALARATLLFGDISALHSRILIINATLDSLTLSVQEISGILSEVGQRSSEALFNAAKTDDIINQIQTFQEEAASLNSILIDAIMNVTEDLDIAQETLLMANESTQSSASGLIDLASLISQLSDDVNDFDQMLSLYRPPPSCNESSSCTPDEIHAETLYSNASIIVNSSVSVYTLRRARLILESIDMEGQLFDYSAINETALRAQQISQESLDQLSSLTTNHTLLRSSAASVSSDVQHLQGRSVSFISETNRTVRRATAMSDRVSRLSLEVKELQFGVQTVQNRTEALFEGTGLDEEANRLFLLADDARNTTLETDRLVTDIEEAVDGVIGSIIQTRENIANASQALDAAEGKFESISMFLNATREAVEQFTFNITTFISENERIISEIDDIIAGLADIHERANAINSPIQLENAGPDEQSYLSLQPPPGRVINDTIQFESMDLYLWTGIQFTVPALLFYAGPVYHGETDPITASRSEDVQEDYFILTVETGNMLQIKWSMGGVRDEFLTPGFVLGFSEIYITRLASQFQVRYGISTGGLGAPDVRGNLRNDSLLFQVSNRTAFLLGGWPPEAQLGVSNSILSLDSYRPFQGQVQLLLFNGEQWGLWNIRGGGAETNFIGPFQRNKLASANTWHEESDSVLSFDGNGYLFVRQFGEPTESGAIIRTLTITSRPNDERDGLVVYAFDRKLNVSMEIAYNNGNLHLLIRRHDTNSLMVNYTQAPDGASSSGRTIEIRYVPGAGFRVNGIIYRNTQVIFFGNLSQVEAWYGGVRSEKLQRPFIPEITTAGYSGCIDVTAEIQGMNRFTINFFQGDHFFDHYLSSSDQKGFTATCLQSRYTREVGFDGSGESYLSYTYLNPVALPNSPNRVVGPTASGGVVISFTFLAQENDGVLLITLSEETTYLAAMLRNGIVEVLIGRRGDESQTLSSSNSTIKLGEWHYLLVEIRSDMYSFYLNGILIQNSEPIPGLVFELTTNNPGPGSSPVMYVGGAPRDITNSILGLSDSLPSFKGCMKDLAFNFSAMSFINTALPIGRRYPVGVSYHTCPFFNRTVGPSLAVRPEIPVGMTCLVAPPPTLENTHGGFHTDTRLTTSNVIGLLNSSWTLRMSLRQIGDGHVLTINSVEGHVISLHIRDGRATLSLSAPPPQDGVSASGSGEGDLMMDDRPEVAGSLNKGIFVPVAISCRVDNVLSLLSCSLSIDEVDVGKPVQVPYMGHIFFPQLPLIFGKINESNSFIGCIRNLATNDIADGFRDVHTDVECYNRTEPGLGFSGVSRLSLNLPENSQTISISFQPQVDNGLLLFLTYVNDSLPALAIGLFNGELRLSNFSKALGSHVVLLSSACNPDNPTFYNLSLVYTNMSVEVSVQGGGEEAKVQLPFMLRTGQQLLTIGNIPTGFTVPEDSSLFQFLLSSSVSRNSLPPGLVGCVREVEVQGNNDLSQLDVAAMEKILMGVCPTV